MKKLLILIVFLILSFSARYILNAEAVLAQFDEKKGDEFEEEMSFDDEDDLFGDSEIEAMLAGKVYMQNLFLDGNILKISVNAEDMNVPTVGIAFHLDYEEAKVHFLKYEPGEFLEAGGDPFYLVQNDNQKGEIVFGETLRRDDRFPVGGKSIVDFYFQIIDKKSWDEDELLKFNFSRTVISTLDTVRQDIQNVKWENLHLDKDGVNQWQTDYVLNSSQSAKTNTFGSEIYSGEQLWKWLFILTLSFFIVRKFLIRRISKNKDDKRHIGSVNFK